MKHTFIYEAVMMNPETAQALLDTNHDLNRSRKPSRIATYANDMIEGRWILTYEPIGIDVNGKLMNGQNRLSAVIRANVEVPMMIVRNVPLDNMSVIDSGLQRNAIDASMVLKLDVPNRVSYIQATRRMMTGFMKSHCGRTPSNTAVLEFLNKYRDGLDFAFEVLPGKIPGITQATVRAVIARAHYTSDKNKLKLFGSQLLSGISLEPVLVHFRTWLLTYKVSVYEVYAKTENALMGFLTKQEFNGRLTAAKSELFNLPE
jgi:hypothetical protein